LISLGVALSLIYLTMRHPDLRERRNMWAYLILTLGSLAFWSLYQMAPSGLQLFADHNVDLLVAGVKVQPQWIQNINTVVIVFGGPLMSAWFVRLRNQGWNIDVPKQFSVSLILMGVGFLALPLGISLAGPDGKTAFVWLFISYVFQSVGELLISPVGYAMIGKLAPTRYQGVMMGSWMLVTGLASLFAGDFSGMLPEPSGDHSPRDQPRLRNFVCPTGGRQRRRGCGVGGVDPDPAPADHRQRGRGAPGPGQPNVGPALRIRSGPWRPRSGAAAAH
jgi:POT family proton-dependent oligopeptide transporter